MSSVETINSDAALVRISGDIGGIRDWIDITAKEVIIGESLLNPGLMTSITFQSSPYTQERNYYNLKNKDLNLQLEDRLGRSMRIAGQKVYRMDNRGMMPLNIGRTEEFTVHACHYTMLENSKMLMSKLWRCTTPSDVTAAALKCVSANQPDIQQAGPARDYIAENINPYQVINQQCNVALDGDDPSFLHWMTNSAQNGNDTGVHHFRSLKNLISAGAKKVFTFRATDQGVINQADYNNPKNTDKVIIFEFPCEFDYLSDLLNGVKYNGQPFTALTTFNGNNMNGGIFGGAGNMMSDECFEAANMKQSMSNKGSNQQDYGCPTDVESHLLLRQARMGLLEKDKIALRFTAPWSPQVHAGDVIRFNWFDMSNALMPESDTYVVASLMHKIQYGGFSSTSFDCIRTRF